MKKSHKWQVVSYVRIRCPGCGIYYKKYGKVVEALQICPHCGEDFELGSQK